MSIFFFWTVGGEEGKLFSSFKTNTTINNGTFSEKKNYAGGMFLFELKKTPTKQKEQQNTLFFI